jgi:hypothetical protein
MIGLIYIEECTMNRKPLDDVIETIGESYRDHIQNGSRFYLEVNIGKQAEALGYGEMSEKYRDAYAVVPLKQAVPMLTST